jgi:LPS export ABC transporter permease LptG
VFTFFELLSDIVKNHIAMSRVGMYLFYLGPKLIYDTAPLGVLVAVLVAFGIMTKQNEITAFKACGISLHRLSVPVVLTASILSVSLFAFDYYVLPDANRKQDALRAEIKNKPIQTYLRPDRRWIFGEKGSRIYYYKYFDTNQEMMVNVSVYDLDPHTFLLKRHISAQRAHWAPNLNTWIFEGGWVREFNDKRDTYSSFEDSTRTFPGLDEPPSYFMKEVKQYTQMNVDELRRYIEELHHSGFDTVRLQVQLYRKFSVPLFALIMAMISVPFAFLTGNRGAMAGVGVSFGIAIAYFSVNQLFEQIGNLNQLPASMAAWSPDAVFALAALYLLVRMRT